MTISVRRGRAPPVGAVEAWLEVHRQQFHHRRGRPRHDSPISLEAAACAHFQCSARTWDRMVALVRLRLENRQQADPIAMAMAQALGQTQAAQTLKLPDSFLKAPKKSKVKAPKNKAGVQSPVVQRDLWFPREREEALLAMISALQDQSFLQALTSAIGARMAALRGPQSSSQYLIMQATEDSLEALLATPLPPDVTRAITSLVRWLQVTLKNYK